MLIRTNDALRYKQISTAYCLVIDELRGKLPLSRFAKDCGLDLAVFRKRGSCPSLATIGKICAKTGISFEEFGKLLDRNIG